MTSLMAIHIPNPPLLSPHSLTTIPTAPTTDTGLQFRRKLLYLESLNINTHKALSKNPHFRASPLETLFSVEQTLTSAAFNLPRAALGRIFDMFPELLTASPTSLLPISHFLLHDVALPHSLIPRAITRCPRILVSDVHSQLRPALHFLRHHLGLSFSYSTRLLSTSPRPVVRRETNMEDQSLSTRVLSTYCDDEDEYLSTRVVSTYSEPFVDRETIDEDECISTRVLSTFRRTPVGQHARHKLNMNTVVLLVSNVENTLMPKLDFLQNLGFKEEEVINMVQRSPALLTYSVENNYTPKIRYFLDVMKGDLVEIKQFPQYFSFSLEGKIKLRHRLLVEHGIRMSLRDMLKVSDGEFNIRLLDLKLRRGQLL